MKAKNVIYMVVHFPYNHRQYILFKLYEKEISGNKLIFKFRSIEGNESFPVVVSRDFDKIPGWDRLSEEKLLYLFVRNCQDSEILPDDDESALLYFKLKGYTIFGGLDEACNC